MDTTPDQPTGSSALCLSCHDETDPVIGDDIIIDLPGGGRLNVPRPTKLRMHPISIDYTDVADQDDFKAVSDVNPGYLRGKNDTARVECASCHDIHDEDNSGFNLLRDGHRYRDAPGGGAICQECHIK